VNRLVAAASGGQDHPVPVFAVTYRYPDDSETARAESRPAHREFLRGLAEEGVLLLSGPYAAGEEPGALLLFRAEAKDALLARLRADPFQVQGLVAEVVATEWEPVSGPLAAHVPKTA
jgi:uncharacterized protein YciI